VIEFGSDAYPAVTEACISCGLCAKACSGANFRLLEAVRERHGREGVDPVSGPILRSPLCSATNFETRVRGTSGGVATQILARLLSTGKIQGALVSGAGSDASLSAARIATTEEELFECSGSRYHLFPWGVALSTMLSSDGEFAVVGLPCQLHSLFKAMKALPALRDKVVFTIGLFCSMNMEPAAVRAAMKLKHVFPEDADEVRFRHGLWPGRVCVRLHGGHNVNLFPAGADEASEFISYLQWCYGQRRCLMCPDYLAVLGDVSLGDPWIRGRDGRYAWSATEGVTVTLCRTQEGVDCIRDMAEIGLLDDSSDAPDRFLQSLRERAAQNRGIALTLAARDRARGCASFETDYLDARERENRKGRGVKRLRLFDLLHIPWLRRMFLRAVFSQFGAVISSLNIWRKRLAWRVKVRRLERPA